MLVALPFLSSGDVILLALAVAIAGTAIVLMRMRQQPGQPSSVLGSPPAAASIRRARFHCPFCGSDEVPVVRKKVAVGGWILLGLFAISVALLPFCWVGLFIRDEYAVCYHCGVRVR
jgi:hypothetical protein